MEVTLTLKDQLSGAMATPIKAIVSLDAVAASASKSLGSALMGSLKTGAATVVSIGSALAAVGSQFKSAYDTIRVGTGATGAELAGLKASFRALASSSGADIQTIGGALTALRRETGQSGSVLEGMTRSLLAFTKVAGGEAVANVRLTQDLFSRWNVATKDQTAALDDLLRAGQASNVPIADLASQVTQFEPQLSALNLGLRGSTALLASLAQAGIPVEPVLSGIRVAATTLAKEGIPLEAGLKGVIAKLQQMKPGVEANTLAQTVFGRSWMQVLDVIQSGGFQFDQVYAAIAGGSDTIAQAAADTKSLGGILAKFRNQLLVSIEPLATPVLGLAKAIALSLSPAVSTLAGWIERAAVPAGELITRISQLPGPVLLAASSLVGLTGGFKLVETALSVLPGPLIEAAKGFLALLGPWALLIPASVALYYALQTNLLGIRDLVQPVVTTFQTGLATLQLAWQTFLAGFQAGNAGGGPLDGLILGLDALQQRFPILAPLIAGFANALALVGQTASSLFAPLLPLLDQAQISFTQLGVALRMLLSGDIPGAVNVASVALASLGQAVLTALSGLATNLMSLGSQLITSITSWLATAVPQVAAAALPLAMAFLSWVGQVAVDLVPRLAAFGLSLQLWVLSQVPVIAGMVAGWAVAFLSWATLAVAEFESRAPLIVSQIVAWLRNQVPVLTQQFLSWATIVVSWIPVAATKLGEGIGRLIGQVVGFFRNHDADLQAGTKGWEQAVSDWSSKAIPAAKEALAGFISAAVTWIRTEGLNALKNAAVGLANGFVSGFMNGLKGGQPAIEQAAAQVGQRVPTVAQLASRAPWDRWRADAAARAAMVDEAAERGFMKGQARAGAVAMIKQAQAGMAAASPALNKQAASIGAGANQALISGLGQDKGAGGGGGGGGAGEDPVQQAMQTVSSVASAISSGIDALEKMFKFRGPPPEDVMRSVFDGLKAMLKLGMKLAKGLDAESAQLGQAVASMLSGFISAFSGMVELGDKLARFRVPTPDSLGQLMVLARSVMTMSRELTKLFGSGDLQKSLEEAAISGKVAETLRSWSETLKSIAESTDAIAKGRWDVDLSPVFSFVSRLATFVMGITWTLRDQLAAELRVAIMDATDVANMLRPWADLIKAVAETTLSLAKARWPSDLSAPERFISQLAQMAVGMLLTLRSRLGPALLLVLDDSKLTAEVLGAWLDPLAKIGEVTTSLSRMRPVSLASLGAWVLALFTETEAVRRSLSAQLGPAILVALSDSRVVAETLGAWLDPLSKMGAAAQSVDTLRAMTQRRWDATLTNVVAFFTDLGNVASKFVTGAQRYAGQSILLVAEDSKLVADGLGSWVDMFSKLGAAATSIDVLRGQSQRRWDPTLTNVVAFFTDLGNVASIFVRGAVRFAGDQILRVADDSKAVAESFGAWLDMFSKLGAAAASIDVMSGYAQRRWDTTLTNARSFLTDLAQRFAPIVAAASRAADPAEAQKLSQAVAQTFGVWLDMFAKVGAATDSIRRMRVPDASVFELGAQFAMSIAHRFAPVVADVARAANPDEQQKLSQTVAQTFGIWLDMFAKLSTATASISKIRMPSEEQVVAGGTMLMSIANRFAPIVADVARGAHPEEAQKLSQTVAQTFGAWIDGFSRAADLTQKLASVKPVKPEALLQVEGLMRSAWDAGQRLWGALVDLDDLVRDYLVTGARSFIELTSGMLGAFDEASKLDLSKIEPLDPTQLSVAEQTMRLAFRSLQTLAGELMPKAEEELTTLTSQGHAFADLLGLAVRGLIDSAKAGADIKDAVAITDRDLGTSEHNARVLLTTALSLSGAFMALAGDAAQELVTNIKLWAEGAGAAVRALTDSAKAGADIKDATAISDQDLNVAVHNARSLLLKAKDLTTGFVALAGKAAPDLVANIKLWAEGEGAAVRALTDAAKSGADINAAVSIGDEGISNARHNAELLLGKAKDLATKFFDLNKEASPSILANIKLWADGEGAAVRALVEASKANLKDAVAAEARDVGIVADNAKLMLDEVKRVAANFVMPAGLADFTKAASDAVGLLGHTADSLAKLGQMRPPSQGQIQSVVDGIRVTVVALADAVLGKNGQPGISETALKAATALATAGGPAMDLLSKALDAFNLDKIMKSGFFVKPGQSAFMTRASGTWAKNYADNVKTGIQLILSTLADALSGAKGPDDATAKAISAIVAAYSPLIDLISKVAGMNVDLKKFSTVVAAARMLVGDPNSGQTGGGVGAAVRGGSSIGSGLGGAVRGGGGAGRGGVAGLNGWNDFGKCFVPGLGVIDVVTALQLTVIGDRMASKTIAGSAAVQGWNDFGKCFVPGAGILDVGQAKALEDGARAVVGATLKAASTQGWNDFGKCFVPGLGIVDVVRAQELAAQADAALRAGADRSNQFWGFKSLAAAPPATMGGLRPQDYYPGGNSAGQALITGPVQAVGPVQMNGDTEVTILAEGKVLEKFSRTGGFRRGQKRDRDTRSNV